MLEVIILFHIARGALAAVGLRGLSSEDPDFKKDSCKPHQTVDPLLEFPPHVIFEERNPASGNFTVWKFPLMYSRFSLYWRRFGVDLPKDVSACGAAGCPIIVDFPGSGGNVFTQRAWSAWNDYQVKNQKFILVTVAGSPDDTSYFEWKLKGEGNDTHHDLIEYVDLSGTSWNVLGWGTVTEPVGEKDTCESMKKSGCFPDATKPEIAYVCYSTHLEENPQNCRNNPTVEGWTQKDLDKYLQYYYSPPSPMIPTNCASASGANDWDYIRQVLKFVTSGDVCTTQGWCGDKERIYFTGQSMGGMASMHFAVQDGSVYELPKDLQPAAVAACSVGGSRINDINLHGKVPMLLMHGSRDDVAPPTVWSGYTRRSLRVDQLPAFHSLLSDNKLIKEALRILGKPYLALSADVKRRKSLLLLADTQTGGRFLAKARDKLANANILGCQDVFGAAMSVSGAYMWETIGTTVHRAVGSPVDMSALNYSTPASKHVRTEKASKIKLKCADVQAGGKVRFCYFNGGHNYPWKETDYYYYLERTPFHEFVYADFLMKHRRGQ